MSLFLITGASGTGKTTLAQSIEKHGNWQEAVSHTTRPMRDGEVDGKTYYFITEEEFSKMLKNGEFAEHVTYNGNHYALSKIEIDTVMKSGNHVFAIVEYYGYLQVKEQYPDAVGIFIHMSKEDCLVNMLLRGDSLENAIERIELYEEEMKHRTEYDYVIKNVRGKKYETEVIIKAIIKQHSEYKGSIIMNTQPLNIGAISKTIKDEIEKSGIGKQKPPHLGDFY